MVYNPKSEKSSNQSQDADSNGIKNLKAAISLKADLKSQYQDSQKINQLKALFMF